MENTKRIDVLFGLVVIAFLVVTLLLVKNFNTTRANDFKEYTATLTNIVKMKNNKIKILASRLMAEQKENIDLKNTLAATKSDLDSLSKKIAPEAATSAPVTATK